MPQNQAKADPYRLLLGISPTEERTHYRLLDIPLFESDLAVIENGRNRRNVALRQIKDGPLLEDAERIKEEIATAFRLLFNPELKAAYDLSLKEKLEPNRSQPATHPLAFDPKFSAEIREQQIEQFREVVRAVFADGIVEEHERLYLQQLHPKLGIDAEVARQIFGEIAKETQERAKQFAEQERLLMLAQQARAKKAEQERLKNEQSIARTQSKREPKYSQSVTVQPVLGQQRPNPSRTVATVVQPKLPRPISHQVSEQLRPPLTSMPGQNLRLNAYSKVNIPAIGILICSLMNMLVFGLNMLFIGFLSGGNYNADEFDSEPARFFAMGFYGFIVLVYIFLFVGSISMYRLGGLSLARWTCGLSILLNLNCCLLGPIFGIWGVIVLADKDVSSCFRRR
jgi:hypothetical protein